MTELLQKVALNNSTRKKRGRPRKQNSEMMLNVRKLSSNQEKEKVWTFQIKVKHLCLFKKI